MIDDMNFKPTFIGMLISSVVVKLYSSGFLVPQSTNFTPFIEGSIEALRIFVLISSIIIIFNWFSRSRALFSIAVLFTHSIFGYLPHFFFETGQKNADSKDLLELIGAIAVLIMIFPVTFWLVFDPLE